MRANREAAGRSPLFVLPGDSAGSVMAGAAETGGALGVVETLIPKDHSPPLHVHRDEDEAIYVLTGTVDFVCGDRQFRAQAGAFVYLPRGLPHTFLGIGDKPARVLVLFLPGGLEDAFAEPERFHELLAARHVQVVGPPLG